MSFKTVYEGIRDILEEQELAEAKNIFSYEDAAEGEFGHTFILNALSGSIDDDMSREIINKFHDSQVWEVQIGFDKTFASDVVNRQLMHMKKEAILAKIDNPQNWRTFVRTITYQEWETIEEDNYVVLRIELNVLDTITHT